MPGNTKHNKLLQVAKIVLSGNIGTTDGQDKGDVKMSGKYLCTKIVDKLIMNNTFTQKITLNRVDYTKG